MMYLTDVKTKSRALLNQLGLRNNKVFAVGFNKSATSSLHKLFSDLALPSLHDTTWQKLDNPKLLQNYDCFSDGTPRDIHKLVSMYPNAKYILQVRDLRSWVLSRLAHIERYKNKAGYRTKPEWDTTQHAVEMWITFRNKHHKNVIETFKNKPEQLIIVNFINDPQAATKVARFLGHYEDFERPRHNVNPIKKANPEHESMLSNALAKLGIPDIEAEYDILCPSLETEKLTIPADTRNLSEFE